MDQDKPLVITTALPYANGPLHAGTLVGYIFTDIYVRALRLSGKKVTYCCADDTHGTPIEINAQKAGLLPEEFVKKWFLDHQRDFKTFGIEFDSYYTTHSPENQYFAELIFKRLTDRGLIYQKEIEVTFCEKCQRTLPDRYVKGKCPKCQAPDQYGDVCEKCNAAYKTVDLIDPYCVLCKSPPIRKKSEHFFFKLSECTDFLEDWLTHNKNLQQEVVNQLLPWVRNGLEDWCISRDGPYFGFAIPGAKDKFFYVWLDAPIGYISSLCNFLGKDQDKTAQAWNNSNIVHVIGKDIIYFHLLFWPAILHHASFKVPDDIIVHGFLTVNGEKMSKSRGTMIAAEELAKKANPEFVRFYYTSNWSHSVTDLDLNTSDFVDRVNSELVSNIANFVYRTLSFVEKNFDSKITRATDITFETQVLTESQNVLEHYRNWHFREAVKGILKISSWGNKYFQDHEPWKLIKEDKEKAHKIASECVNAIKVLIVLLKPLVPIFASKIEQQLNISPVSEKSLSFDLKDHTINQAEIIYKKLESFELVSSSNPTLSFSLSPALKQSGVKVALAVVKGAKISNKSSVLKKKTEELAEQLRFVDLESNKILQGYRDLYRLVNYAEGPSAAEQLIDFIQKGTLPNINTVVDAYNLVSAETFLSFGAHDLTKIKGNISFKYVTGSEHYHPLGSSAPVKVQEGEYACVDEEKILCRLEVKQCEESKITKNTKDFMIYAQGNQFTDEAYVRAALEKACKLITEVCGGSYEILQEGGGSISPLSKLNLKVAKVLEAKEHPDADKLYILQIDLGSEKRQIVAGMRPYYTKEEITGKNIVVVTNLEPRMLKGELSKGMLLACEEAGVVGLVLAQGATPGDAVTVQGVEQGNSVIKYDDFTKVVLEGKEGKVFADGQPLCSLQGQLVTDKVKNGKIR
ncbi:MAG: methionine--tRNA ligase [Nanoarchaeota archaeon]